jgi:hypothetical protein
MGSKTELRDVKDREDEKDVKNKRGRLFEKVTGWEEC